MSHSKTVAAQMPVIMIQMQENTKIKE